MSPTLPKPGLSPSPARQWQHTLLLSLVLLVALSFIVEYVLHYYWHYGEAEFTTPPTGAANYWRMRGWLMLHITSGTLALALVIGPLQLSARLRRRYLQVHRITGRIYVIAILIACTCAIRLAVETSFEKGFGFGFWFALGTMAVVWASATLMAFYAVLEGQIVAHREWMIRSYVVMFGFVTFRTLSYSPLFAWLPDSE